VSKRLSYLSISVILYMLTQVLLSCELSCSAATCLLTKVDPNLQLHARNLTNTHKLEDHTYKYIPYMSVHMYAHVHLHTHTQTHTHSHTHTHLLCRAFKAMHTSGSKEEKVMPRLLVRPKPVCLSTQSRIGPTIRCTC
jgi:hypothetical protein